VIPAIRKSEPGINNVFLCSMADLFGDWVPDEWILQILEVIARHPEYNFIALTKNPKRYLKFTFPKNIWLGATADTQKRFDVAMDVFRLMRKCENIKFLSCEPLLEKIDFIDDCGEFEEFDADNMHEYEERMERYNDHLSHLENEHRTKVVTLGYVDWVIIGGLKGSENSTKQPNWGWVETLIEFARKSNAAVYFKTNLTVVPKELPAGVETVSSPVQGQLLS
jgi:protein gp37